MVPFTCRYMDHTTRAGPIYHEPPKCAGAALTTVTLPSSVLFPAAKSCIRCPRGLAAQSHRRGPVRTLVHLDRGREQVFHLVVVGHQQNLPETALQGGEGGKHTL